LLVGLANAGLIISDLTLVLEFAPTARRPTYMGIARGLLGPWIGLAPIIGGILLARLGYAALLTTGWVLTCVGLVMVTALVKEPRLRQA
jgi:MFS family permease